MSLKTINLYAHNFSKKMRNAEKELEEHYSAGQNVFASKEQLFDILGKVWLLCLLSSGNPFFRRSHLDWSVSRGCFDGRQEESILLEWVLNVCRQLSTIVTWNWWWLKASPPVRLWLISDKLMGWRVFSTTKCDPCAIWRGKINSDKERGTGKGTFLSQRTGKQSKSWLIWFRLCW